MAAHKSKGRDAYDADLAKLGPLPPTYTLLVRMKRPDFTPDRIYRAKSGKCADFEVLDVLKKVSDEFVKSQLQPA